MGKVLRDLLKVEKYYGIQRTELRWRGRAFSGRKKLWMVSIPWLTWRPAGGQACIQVGPAILNAECVMMERLNGLRRSPPTDQMLYLWMCLQEDNDSDPGMKMIDDGQRAPLFRRMARLQPVAR